MKRRPRKLVFGILLSAFLLPAPPRAAASGPREAKSPHGDAGGKPVAQETAPSQFAVPPPPFSEGIFPCSQCHKDMTPNPRRRELKEEHTNIVLNHAQGQRWCLDCHDTSNRDRLRLVSGERIAFSESYRLCGQCHGDKYRDWKVGVHGKRTGYWNGKKQYLLCAHCHNPHDPRFKPITPEPPPVRPENLR